MKHLICSDILNSSKYVTGEVQSIRHDQVKQKENVIPYA